MSKRVIVDIDAGTDDAFALILLLHGNVDIVAITCVNGNTVLEHVYNNVLRILKLCDREDIPVYLGAAEALINTEKYTEKYFHGKDGFGDLEYEDDNVTVKPSTCDNGNKSVDRQQICEATKDKIHNAIYMMNKIVAENPGEISLICLGPLTNVALTMKVHSIFASQIKEIFIMGGNHKGVGNMTSAAEFNFHVDPEAAYIVLHFAKCPITILPWEPCNDSTIPFDWRWNVLGNTTHPTMKLLNAADKSIYPADSKFWLPCDAFLAAIFLYPDIATSCFTCHASVELSGIKTRAQMVINHTNDLEPNVSIITEISYDLFQSVLLKTFNK